MLRKRFSSVVLIIAAGIAFSCSAAKTDHHIKVTIEGLQDSISILAYYYGSNQYIKDTAFVDENGTFEFKGDEQLDKGMYIVFLHENNFFDIIIDRNQHFEITTDIDDLVGQMKVSNSPENASFYNYLKDTRPIAEEKSNLRQKIMNLDPMSNERDELIKQFEELDEKLYEMQDKHINEFPDGLFTAILKAQREVPVPEAELLPDGTTDRASMYRRYINEYWKNIDFSDDRLVRTPVFHQKLNHFFNSVVIQIPDSIITAADRIIEKSRAHDEMFKYTVWFVMNLSERSNIMGIDKLFVHMAENYYLSGETHWVGEEQIERISERAETLKPLLLGAIAPDVEVFTPDKQAKSLHSVDAKYTVLYFWDSECAHCKVMTPKLRDVYQRLKPVGLEVFALNVEADREKWLKYMEKNKLNWINVHDPVNTSGFRDLYDIFSIPIVYVLDEDKKILAKSINAEQVEDLINHLERQKQ